jgi:DNA primase
MEGFMDVIRACSVGINNCVALMGTSLTDFHIDLISRLTKNIYICLDGDPPGVRASMKAGEQFLDKGIEVKIIELPNPDDPDSYILREGKNNFEALIDVASNFNEYKIKKLKEDIDSKSSIDVSRYVQEVILQLSRIDDEIRIEIELKKLAKEYDLSYNSLE